MNTELTLTNVTIDSIKETIFELGKNSKTLCYKVGKYLEENDSKEARKKLMEETELSKQSLSSMCKAYKLYSTYSALEDLTHTKIVELAPLDSTNSMVDGTRVLLGTEDLTAWCDYSQKEIRDLVSQYTREEDTEDTEDTEETEVVESEQPTVEELKTFFNNLVKNYDIEKDDANTLKFYLGI